ncbi:MULTISPECIES: ATP-binding cassette domain-containing protein [unclassified Streptomyces]|uniref:ABC transporter ATP-binding protein n=1 Tax=unclassified Streptomyces TaxID=2593676 RepID=UPI000CD5657E|nr:MULTISPECIES: ATP-binding cassette domain-containing protein [unclassified Streptomyces]RPK43551.1 putative ABC transporter ATP-binding protein [Streptomyces sp. ADI93-02]
MIDIKNLSKSFGARTVWSDISFTVNGGEMLALIGPSGSGKSTLLNCLGLLERPDKGEICYEGKDITRFGRRDIRRYRRDTLGYLFQHYALIETATVQENLEVVTKLRRSSQRPANTSLAEVLDRVGLTGREEEKISHLSGGEQQRVALARLMIQQPTVVLADEPTGALDDANSTMVIDILEGMSKSGCSVVIATHDDSVRSRCDAVFAVHDSSLVGSL